MTMSKVYCFWFEWHVWTRPWVGYHKDPNHVAILIGLLAVHFKWQEVI